MNKTKSEILAIASNDETIEIAGVKVKDCVRYLGMRISTDVQTTISHAKSDIQRYLAMVKGRLRYAAPQVKEEVLGAYVRQLLIYFSTPLVVAKAIKLEAVDRWEEEIYRKMYLLPKDLKRSAIVNIARQRAPASDIVKELAQRNILQIERQMTLERIIVPKKERGY